MDSNFPRSPGLYIAQRDDKVVLIKITGLYPTLELGKAISVDQLINSNTIRACGKETLENIHLFSDKWSFKRLEGINMNAFPKTSFRVDGNLSLSDEDYLHVKGLYYRLSQSGVPISKIEESFMYEYKITKDQVEGLIKKFDDEQYFYAGY